MTRRFADAVLSLAALRLFRAKVTTVNDDIGHSAAMRLYDFCIDGMREAE